MDTAKAVAALATNPGDILDYLEVIGGGKSLSVPSMPCIAVPTTAGTGSEVTRNAVLAIPQHGLKVSMRSSTMLPRLAIVDPQLTLSLPQNITAQTGLDALTQLIEPFVSNQPNPLTDSICREGIHRSAGAIRTVYYEGENLPARENMSLASLFGGMALANAKLGAVHGFAGVLGGMYDAPHGALCARLLPEVMEVNVRALHERAADGRALERYREVAQILNGDANATDEDGVNWIRGLCTELNFLNLSDLGVQESDFRMICEKAEQASSMKGNPIRLSQEEMLEILDHAYS